ncbi:MAG: hypothetical protein RMX61_00455 [Planktomarina sp.]|jgi:hypothetical protein|nr:hypothetical protein [Planktomarina sp.]MDT2032559.1 hypothetical protein [Planktomarina sp.]MDT2038960.1 hypothetical protein [Planktomarina sp.]MDT2048857.1 hypothetical protein [Planktomarina sp.]|tara:strand:+ start:2552 stop:2719 length:168 start_codon:yes stop_codon:yes gene_type:complete
MNNKGTGAANQRGNTPKHAEHNAKGSSKNPFGKGSAKAELLVRMKAAAEARKAAK